MFLWQNRFAPQAPNNMPLRPQIVLHLWLQKKHLWQQKIWTSGYKRYAPLALNRFALLFPNRFAPLAPKMIHTFGNKRNAPLFLKHMHLWLQMIRISCSKRYAPLATKDMHIWQQKVWITGSNIWQLWFSMMFNFESKRIYLWFQKTCSYEFRKCSHLTIKDMLLCSQRYMHLCLQKICISGFKLICPSGYKKKINRSGNKRNAPLVQ